MPVAEVLSTISSRTSSPLNRALKVNPLGQASGDAGNLLGGRVHQGNEPPGVEDDDTVTDAVDDIGVVFLHDVQWSSVAPAKKFPQRRHERLCRLSIRLIMCPELGRAGKPPRIPGQVFAHLPERDLFAAHLGEKLQVTRAVAKPLRRRSVAPAPLPASRASASRKIQGLPRPPRAIITPSQPVSFQHGRHIRRPEKVAAADHRDARAPLSARRSSTSRHAPRTSAPGSGGGGLRRRHPSSSAMRPISRKL